MGIKKITNSPSGRIAIMLIAMCTVGLTMCGSLLWWLVWQPQVASSDLEKAVKELSTSWGITDVKVGEEENPLDGLPSTTLSYRDVSNSPGGTGDISTSMMFPVSALGKTSLDSLVNVSSYYTNNSTETSLKGDYTLKYYSDELDDYKTGGGYLQAAQQFAEIYKSSLAKFDYSSAPTPNGGRIINISVQSSASFQKSSQADGKSIWENLVRSVEKTTDFTAGQVVNLRLIDSSGLVSLSTVLVSPEDVINALTVPEGMWSTFNILLEDTDFVFLKVQKLSYQVESAPQASTLTITVDESLKGVPDLRLKIWRVGIETTPQTLIPWSYITYLVTPNDPSPFLASYSTSRNW